jgi:preprotein translocase subunit SecA
MLKTIKKFFVGNTNNKIIAKYRNIVTQINSYENNISLLNDSELRDKTIYFREKLANGASLDDILPEAFAVVREGSKRALNMRHFDVQMIGGLCLHNGNIAEMATGEGKTLVATLAAYLNALPGKGVHIVTVNDYLVQRDSEWMGNIFRFLGLTVGCITHSMHDHERKNAYACDITYGTNSEFGFDYLRDNMKFHKQDQSQRLFNYAIIDEVDSILIDEARTPLVISGPSDDNSDLYAKINKIIPLLSDKDYEIDEKSKTVTLTEEGSENIENLLSKHKLLQDTTSLYDINNMNLVHHINQALRAHKLFSLDVDYMIKNKQILIIDEFTGRALEGRRYSEGLHQALEAKENVPIKNENQTLASITYQNYFRLYPKISGMAGTAVTEEQEFADIYNLGVVEIPTNKPKVRIDGDDEIYRTTKEKYTAIMEQIEECYNKKQPVLVGTISIEKSEDLSKLLEQKNITHKVLNAKYHEQEAQIIAQAGMPGAVTIATNMAGRGTDIKLGGSSTELIDALSESLSEEERAIEINKINEEIENNKQKVIEAGGLFVIGTERHESRRIDNQLRGRSGRQGDPGESKFYLSLEDDLMRIFASERISSLLGKLGLKEGEAITHPMISRALEKAQHKVEVRNFDIRKNLLKFDDVANEQRRVIYDQRNEIMILEELNNMSTEMAAQINEDLVDTFIPEKSYVEQWDLKNLEVEILRIYGVQMKLLDIIEEKNYNRTDVLDELNNLFQKILAHKLDTYGQEMLSYAIRRVLLLTLDGLWKDHLHSLDHLRQGISLRSYAQKDPLLEYKKEAFELFFQLLDNIRINAIQSISHMTINLDNQDTEKDNDNTDNEQLKIGRNDPCHCDSGLKFKHCHGKL